MESFRGGQQGSALGWDWSSFDESRYGGSTGDGALVLDLPGETAEDAGAQSPPPAIGQDERRMQVRAYNAWADLLGDRKFPDIADLDPANCGDFGSHSVLLDFSAGIEDPGVRFLGDRIAEECGARHSRAIAALSDVPAGSLLSRITDHYIQILSRQAPIGFEAEFVNRHGKLVIYRGILLPFSSDDRTIDHIYGVMNWKEVADTPLSEGLARELAAAIVPRKKPVRQVEDPLPAPLSQRLRAMTPRSFDTLDEDGPQFTLLLARRLTSGNVMLLSEVPVDADLIAQVAKQIEDR